jgi:hypothetical protein
VAAVDIGQPKGGFALDLVTQACINIDLGKRAPAEATESLADLHPRTCLQVLHYDLPDAGTLTLVDGSQAIAGQGQAKAAQVESKEAAWWERLKLGEA